MGNAATDLLDRARRYVLDGIWAEDLGPRKLTAALIRGLQLCVLIGRGFIEDQLLLRASALTYMTSLAIIPILVVLLSVIQWLGFSNDLATLVVDQLLAGSPGAVDRIMAVVENANVGALGTVGFAIFLITTILSLRHAEETFNDIWGARSQRSWVRRFTNYLGVLVVVPLLLGTAISLAATLRSDAVIDEILSHPLFNAIGAFALGGAPIAFLFGSFSLLYWLLPNTPVRVVSALLGGAIAALLFTAAQSLYVDFSIGVARYNALFGGFAILPLLLVWIYLSWSIVLLGAEIANAHQNLDRYRREARHRDVRSGQQEALGLRIAVEIARGFRDRWPPQSAETLAEQLGSSLRTTSGLLERLEGAGIVSRCEREEGELHFQLGRPAEDVAVGDVLLAIRGERRLPADGEGSAEEARASRAECAVSGVLADLDQAIGGVAARSLAQILQDVPPEAPAR